MRLGIVTQYYPPEIGAPQARLSQLAEYLAERGHQVHVLTAMPNYPCGHILSGYGGLLTIEHAHNVRITRTFIYPTQTASFLPRLANYFSFVLSSIICGTFLLGRLDYLLIESPPLFLGISGFWLGRCKRARIIFNVSDLWPESAVRMGIIRRGGLAYRLSSKLEGFLYRHSWLVTGQSKSILEDISRRFPDGSFFHLSNGVDTSKFNSDRRTPEARALLGSVDTCVVLYAGLHGLAQGLEQVIEAAKAVRAELNVKFVLIGDGPEKQRLLNAVQRSSLDNVLFLDAQPSDAIPALVASADIVIVPLKTYIPGAVPSKLYEAMASARPVILVAKGEAANIVETFEVGLVVEPGDIASLVSAVKRLSSDPELRQCLGRKGCEAAMKYFNRERIAADFAKYLEEAP